MIDGLRTWLLTIIATSILCALADSLMPQGAVKRVGKLVLGLVLLGTILAPVVEFDIQGSQGWLNNWFATVGNEKIELEEQVNEGMKIIIEQEYAAYIVDKAAEMGLTCTVRVNCRAEEGNLYVPDGVEVAGLPGDDQQSKLIPIIREDLGVPEGRQTYYSEEELP